MGYEKDLLILPFDHRGSMLKKLFGVEGREPTGEEAAAYSALKWMVYQGFLKSIEMGVPKEKAAILIDEQFGKKIIEDAKEREVLVAMPIEKSGQNEFDFEENNFKQHIARVDPDFVKVLVRYNPEDSEELNTRQLRKLKMASDYCKEVGKSFIFELLVPATEQQMNKAGEDKKKYDMEMRPALMVKAIKEIQDFGVEPDVWKIEGVERIEDSQALVAQAKSNGRTAGIITLGRGENTEKVKEWLKVGAKVKGIIGFAVGRTVFLDAMIKLNNKEVSEEEAATQVANNYKEFVDLWNEARE